MSILAAQHLSCEKQDRILFQDIDLTIDSGELVLLKGENGAGKTSLMRILVGLSTPASGNVKMMGHCVKDELDDASKALVYVGHKAGVNTLLTAVENLVFWCTLKGISHTKDAINHVLHTLGLTGLEDISVKNLSAGQQRRVALAKLWLMPDAKLWILDEPFTALDVQLVQALEAHIAQFLSSGGAVLMTSHQRVSIDHFTRVFELENAW